MSLTPAEFAELHGLLEDLCEGRITPDRQARLEAIVIAEPQAEELYIATMTLQAGLLMTFAGSAKTLPAADVASIGPEARRPGRLRLGRFLGAIALAAAVVGAVGVGLALRDSHKPRPPDAADPGAMARAPALSAPVSRPAEGPLGVVTQMWEARWEAGAPAPIHGRALSPGRFRLAGGRVALALVNGVMLTVEGPADFDLVSVDRVFCRRGKLRARVPQGAEGFVVTTSSSAVVDMGTEFALNIDEHGHAQVMVIEGAVEAALLDRGGVPTLTRSMRPNEAVEVDPEAGRIATSAARPERFAAATPNPARPLVLEPGYRDAVLAARPRGYWRFEAVEAGIVPDEVPGGPALRVNGPVEVGSDGGRNGCATFRPGVPGQFLTSDTLFELTRTPGHAVEFWFQADRYMHASLVGFVPSADGVRVRTKGPDAFVHALLVELTAREHQTLNKPASVRFLHRWPLEARIGKNLFADRDYVPWTWHHVVAQRASDRIELYLDGVVAGLMPLEGDYPELDCRLIVGRRTTMAANPSDAREFVGRLDELAIYDHILSLEDVRAHFALARPEAGPG